MRVQIKACWRLLRIAVHVVVGLWMVAWRFPRLSVDQQGMHVQAWSVAILRHLGIALQVRGQPPLRAVACCGEPETAQGRGRREWGVQLREAVDVLRQP